MAKGFQDSGVQSRCAGAQSEPVVAAAVASKTVGMLPTGAGAGGDATGSAAPCDEADLLIQELASGDDEVSAITNVWTPVKRSPRPHQRVVQPAPSRADDDEYPEFHETNPFRLPPRRPPPRDSRRHSESVETVVQRRRGDEVAAGSTLARRRGSLTDLTLQMPSPNNSMDGVCVHRVASETQNADEEGAVGGRSAGCPEDIWQRLPTPDHLVEPARHCSSASRFLSVSPFSLGQSVPTADETRDEGQELFLAFVRDRIEEDLPKDVMPLAVQQNDEYIDRIMALPGLRNPIWSQTGSELRCMADAFASSHQRLELRSKAEQTDLTEITWDRFRKLLEELFAGEAGVTQERILVLFFFLADCVVATLRRHAWRHLRRLIQWSLRYIVERVCALVQEAGGWTVVFRSSIEYLIMISKISAFILLGAAAFMYIRKNM